METIVGFVIGYLVGAREGPGGLDRVRTSLRSIRESPQLHELTTEASAFAAPIIKQVTAGSGGTLFRSALGAVTHRNSAPTDDATRRG